MLFIRLQCHVSSWHDIEFRRNELAGPNFRAKRVIQLIKMESNWRLITLDNLYGVLASKHTYFASIDLRLTIYHNL